jgi:enamine deaminase RidA (YjgF/YER057c/UK114 family)
MSLDGRDFDGVGDPARQVEVAMQNVRTLLADAGASLDDVCKITTYLTNPSHRPQIDAVLASHLADVRPVVTSIDVDDLARPELDFEIDVFVLLPGDEPHRRISMPAAPGAEVMWPQSQVVRAGRFVFLQGQSGLRLDGSGLTGAGDAEAQAEQAMQNVKVLLEESGGCMKDICKITTFVTDQAMRKDVYPVFGKHLDGVNPTSTGLVVEALWKSELQVAIDVFAVIGDA